MKRANAVNASSLSQLSHHRNQCIKCSPSTSKSIGCHSNCLKSIGTNHSNSRHYVTSELNESTRSLPSNTSIDCRSCQMPLSNSAPVTPTNISIESTSASSPTNSKAFDFRNSSNDLLMCSPFTSMTNQTLSSSPICIKCSNIEIENTKTKTKLDQLRLVMQQRREQREARKMRSAPYGGRIDIGAAAATTSSTNSTNSNDTTNATGVTIQATVDAPPIIVEQVNIA